MTFTNPLIEAWKNGRKVIGGWQTLPDALAAEIAARQGLGYVCIDQQHGLIDDSAAFPMLQGITAGGGIGIVRPRWNEPAAIMSALDGGAYGVIIPMIETPEHAAAAVHACRFPPYGQRSYGPIRARDIIGSTDPREIEKVACIIMIETAEAIARLDEILAVPGLDAVYIGPSDLALALGEKPGTTSPVLQENIDRIIEAAHRHGLAAGIHTAAGDVARRYLDQGLDFATMYSDAGLLAWAVQQQIAAVGDLGTGSSGDAGEVAAPSVY